MARILERRTKSGIKYQATIRIKGYESVTATYDRKTDAKRWAAKTEEAIRQGKYFSQTEGQRHTVKDAIERYRTTILPQKAPSTIPTQAGMLRWWEERIGDQVLSHVTPAVITGCRDSLLLDPPPDARGRRAAVKERLSPTTVNHYMMLMGHVFTLCVREWGWLADTPMVLVRKPRMTPGRVRFLSTEEREKLLEACRQSKCRLLYPAVLLAMSTGMRRNEQFQLTWDRVDFDRAMIRLELTKNRERRGLPLTGSALEALKVLAANRRADISLVFPSHDGKKPFDIRRPFVQALATAKIDNFHWHDFRHTCASYLAMSGASLADIAEVLGHKCLSMVKRYAHLSPEHVVSVIERMNRQFIP